MQIVLHLGAHCTDEGRVLSTLRNNRRQFARMGIAAPQPGHFRPPLREALMARQGAPIGAEAEAALIAAASDIATTPARLVLSSPSLLCGADRALGEGRIYPMIETRSVRLRALFPSHDVEFHMALCDPAVWLPGLARLSGKPLDALLESTDPADLRWSDAVARLGAANPGCRVVVWANEESPVLWPEILRAVAGHDPAMELRGIGGFLDSLLTEEGAARMAAYLAEHPAQTDARRRKVAAAFLERYPREDAVEADLDAAGWDADTATRLGAIYEADLAAIAALPGIEVVAP